MPYEQHVSQPEAIADKTAEQISHSSASGVHSFPDFKFQEYVFSRLSTTERLATSTLKEVKRQAHGLDERFASHSAALKELLASAENRLSRAVTDDLQALRYASAEDRKAIEVVSKKSADAFKQLDDFYEILNSLAKFHHRLDGIESALRSEISDLQHGLEASRASYEQRLAALEETTHRRISTIEARMDPLEIRVAILSSTTLFFRAIARRFKKRIAQLRNRT